MSLRVKNIEVGNRIGEASKFRIYSGKTDNGEPVILKVAKKFEDGDILAEEASKFNILKTFETQVALLQEQEDHTNSHYDWLFANLSSSFIEPTQGDRRINVFTIPDIDLNKLIPLTKLHGEIEIDARTSVWILGRFLKFYSFFELLAAFEENPVARYPLFSPDDYLIGPEKHHLIYYNFSGDMADVVAFDFVKTVAKFILDWTVIGDDSSEQRYFDLLKDFSECGRDSFEEAHGDLYRLVKELWGIQYHPFTYRDRNTSIWKTIGCPMDIEVSCDTTGSMGGEVDTEMAVLPDLYDAVSNVLPGYDPQLCLGIFGDVCDEFVMCRPQFEMEAPKIVNYLKEMAPQRAGGDSPEDPQYAMFARAYLTDAYTNNIGLKGYHFVVTDATGHYRIIREDIMRIFGKDIFDNDLKNMTRIPSMKEMVQELKNKTHQFILVINSRSAAGFWRELCGEKSVIEIDSTRQLPAVISAIIGLTEGTVDVTGIEQHLGGHANRYLISQLSNIDIGAQAKLRHKMAHPVPKAGDIFTNKGDVWPTAEDGDEGSMSVESSEHIEYL